MNCTRLRIAAPATSQWALSTNPYDLAVMCPDAAASLLEKDRRFEVVSPVLVNSDIVVVRRGLSQKIGISQNRSHQERITACFRPEVAAVSMLPSAIPTPMRKGGGRGGGGRPEGFTMAGEKIPAPAAAGGHVTYVLVVNKSFKEDPRYHEFIHLFQAAAEELNNPDVLVEEIKNTKHRSWERGGGRVEPFGDKARFYNSRNARLMRENNRRSFPKTAAVPPGYHCGSICCLAAGRQPL